MRIVNHKLEGVPYDPAKTIGPAIDPKFLVMHYTAGYTSQAAINVFNSTVIAAHLVVDPNGSVVQMVPFNRRANHAGPSKWMGVSMLNNHSIGIEFVNIGWAKMRADGRLVDSYGNVIPEDYAKTFIEAPNARVGSGRLFWAPYTPAQVDVGLAITAAILGTYNIRDIVSHEEIDTRGWKTDPGPAFPMNRFTALMRGSEIGEKPANGMVGTVNTATLNIRGGPGTNFPVIGATKLGSRLGIIENKNGWFRIQTLINNVPGSGWVLDDYVDVT